MGEPTAPKRQPLPPPDYYELTRGRAPSESLVEALKHVAGREAALDMGSGSGRDTLFLLEQGFERVVALDAEPAAASVLQHVPESRSGQLEFVQSAFDDFDFGVERFDLINAQFSLPFNSPATFDDMFERLKVSLRPGGVFVGVLFGDQDGWNQPGSTKTFHTKTEAEELAGGLEIIQFSEVNDVNDKLANGDTKHWHHFQLTLRKAS